MQPGLHLACILGLLGLVREDAASEILAKPLFPWPSSSVCQMGVCSLFSGLPCLMSSKVREKVMSCP